MSRTNDNIRFWRSAALPWLEARLTRDGRHIAYGLHSHDAFSLGAILGGRSVYRYHDSGGEQVLPLTAGAVVAMNPGEVHACNPVDDLPWSYGMLYIDADYLAGLQPDGGPLRPVGVRASRDAALYGALATLFDDLFDTATRVAPERVDALLRLALATLEADSEENRLESAALAGVATLIRERCTETLTLEGIASQAGMSVAHLVRAFRRHYGITPHAFVIDCRLRYGQQRLRQGASIAEAALASRFADQAHFQRVFKRLTAATPGRYRHAISE
ncbi:helix-turn-helix transcriptional regulator [Kushneria aurantia]|uniref:AraC family transcriptional regulator n=1 Tax=Kushneria aurantia TaxID=504092 RepID=A0ABV6G056_9GAMM|nr:AraC family transcriptional regulator [Kushneria aurantia]